jgi:membrane protein DedA with SNARE-associated domain
MNDLDAFLDTYGLLAIFCLMLVKATGVPVPIPGDLILLATAARAAEGRWVLWHAFIVILLAQVLGGMVQFWLARGPGRGALYRFGRYLGLTAARLDRAAAFVQRGGALGIGLAILTPGLRAAAVAGCGLAGLSLGTFVPGLLLGSIGFLSLHFLLGYLGGALLGVVAPRIPVGGLIVGALVLMAIGLVAWALIRKRQRPSAPTAEVVAEALGAWHEATCPACLLLGSAEDHLAHAGHRPASGSAPARSPDSLERR